MAGSVEMFFILQIKYFKYQLNESQIRNEKNANAKHSRRLFQIFKLTTQKLYRFVNFSYQLCLKWKDKTV